MKCNFGGSVSSIAKTILSLYLEQFDFDESEKYKQFASFEFQAKVSDDEVMSLIEKWSELNNGKETLFEDGLKDAMQIWNIIWKSEAFKKISDDFVCKGYRGMGVFDKQLKKFIPCELGEHYETIKEFISKYHPSMWEIHQEFKKNRNFDVSMLDKFILENFVLIGNLNKKSYYTLSNLKF